ncbi:2-phosphosulfolactate phosphatase [Kyrpidia sp.]|uniref:2-phosphosulfolactate phosphatase n=1 Tax=Kyrpidia sp. TaxID=2073077 RepID=UPI0025845ACE|nr:2-phosphosulfolactate phosphatase [Kyrpidia sp.]MCL6577049.1 2-phosphosulfolactate phosphatase [Kyrpidia sp.]
MNRVYLWTAKEQIDPDRLRGAAAVVMDVLLATTTMITMMERGAGRVFPARDLADALDLKRTWMSPRLLTGGEEDGREVPGFDLGPFPEEYTEEGIAGRDVVFLTTNGTPALRRAEGAERVLLASLRNAPAVAKYVQEANLAVVYLICAGSKGRLSLEDALCAGVIADRLGIAGWELDDGAILVRDAARMHDGRMVEALSLGRVGRWFTSVGRRHTLEFAGTVGASTAVVGLEDGRLRLFGD